MRRLPPPGRDRALQPARLSRMRRSTRNRSRPSPTAATCPHGFPSMAKAISPARDACLRRRSAPSPQWVTAGAAEGDPKDLPPKPRFVTGWQLGQPDLVVTLDAPYTLAAGGGDVFRNFVLPAPVSKTKYVRAIEVRPGNKRIVHHANVLLDRSGWAAGRTRRMPARASRAWTSASRRRDSIPTVTSCSGSRAQAIPKSLPAWPGSWSLGPTSCSIRTFSPAAEPNNSSRPSGSTSRTRRPQSSRCWFNWSMTERSTSHRARRPSS